MPAQDADFLVQLGFETAGEWVLDDGQPGLRLAQHGEKTHVLYAFVAQGRALYIGKSVRPLRKRLNNYEKPGPTQATNKRVREALCKVLLQGTAVRVMVLWAREPILYKGVIAINLAAGLEDGLIEHLKPLWNQMGVRGRTHDDALP